MVFNCLKKMSSIFDIWSYFLYFFLFVFPKWKERESFSDPEFIYFLLQIVSGNSDIELSDEEDQDAVFEAEAEEDGREFWGWNPGRASKCRGVRCGLFCLI